jgi:predicted TIM-barrel fold metal-dependent hydrolase
MLHHASRRNALGVLFAFALVAGTVAAAGEAPGNQGGQAAVDNRLSLLEQMPKIDSHAHVYAIAPEQRELFAKFLSSHNLRWLDICTGGLAWERLQSKMNEARLLHGRYPEQVIWAPSFNLTNWEKPAWRDEALALLASSFTQGAVAVKVWKEIGMVLRDPDGRYVMIDDARLKPVLDFIEKRGKTLVAHLGEPRNCWLPLDQMTTASDKRYFGAHPEYHGYLHPEVPGYREQIAARDHLLELHPRLKVVGCHLGSLEYDVDEVARRLDRFPNFAVDLSARLVHLQIQPREKVRAFLIKYQDRLLYGTDMGFGDDKGVPPADPKAALAGLEDSYRKDAAWLATDAMVDVPRAGPLFRSQGVELPGEVLRKIYYDNARRWYALP